MQRLFDHNFHDWEVMPPNLIKSIWVKTSNFVLIYALKSLSSKVSQFFYQKTFQKWSRFLSVSINATSTIMLQFLVINK